MTPSWIAYGKGLTTMASLIVAIGAQNAFVLRQGLKRQSVFTVATICLLGDALFVILGTAGLSALLSASPVLNALLALCGAVFLTFYGLRSLKAAKNAKGLDVTAAEASRTNIVMTALALTFLNPHVIIDTVVLVGGLAARYQGAAQIACAAGAITASSIWFYGIAYGARRLAPLLTQPKIWRIIDLAVGAMMLTLAFWLAVDGARQLATVY